MPRQLHTLLPNELLCLTTAVAEETPAPIDHNTTHAIMTMVILFHILPPDGIANQTLTESNSDWQGCFRAQSQP
jgi:hypothetical protein